MLKTICNSEITIHIKSSKIIQYFGDLIWSRCIFLIQRVIDTAKENTNSFIEQKYSIDAAVVLRIVCDLGILAPHNFAPGCDQPQLADVNFDDGTLRDDALKK